MSSTGYRTYYEAPDGRRLETTTSSEADLDRVLADVAPLNLGPVMLIPWKPEGDSVAPGPGHPVSLVNYADGVDPPYYTSLGNLKDFDPGPDGYLFSSSGQVVGPLTQNYVLAADARPTLREFICTSSRPTCLNWEEL